ncbi:MAG TPA: 5-formyltetrahydrofolate cyclo-ligase [Methylomirabilota bacterium]|nr:5-formyltetrahydrofolate cyclo-ligase [Methylomirabilota bacterium]
MSLTKQELRESLKTARLALSEKDRQRKSTAILARLKTVIDWSQVRSIHCFEPISELGEVDVKISELNKSSINLNNIYYTSRKKDKNWEVVPLKSKIPIPDGFDVIIVPMLGFDKTLNRIGYGGGYYDKFLANQPDAQKIGVCFEQGKVEHIPAEPHDIPLDIIITEEKVYSSV